MLRPSALTGERAPDRWAEASAYEAFMGRWSRPLVARLVETLDVPPGAHWLELGCGTGALTQAIIDHAAPASVVACDPSADVIAFAREHQSDRRVRFEVASASRLPQRDRGFDALASNLVLNFLPDPVAALRAMRLAASPQGVVAASVWDYADGMQYLRAFWDAATALDPAAAQHDEGTRFPLCAPEPLHAASVRPVSPMSRCTPRKSQPALPTSPTTGRHSWAASVRRAPLQHLSNRRRATPCRGPWRLDCRAATPARSS